jgi:hypothetical protein
MTERISTSTRKIVELTALRADINPDLFDSEANLDPENEGGGLGELPELEEGELSEGAKSLGIPRNIRLEDMKVRIGATATVIDAVLSFDPASGAVSHEVRVTTL